MTEAGNIRNERLARTSRIYDLAKASKLLPRGITPTDMDAVVEAGGQFLFMEFKTTGVLISKGQGMMFERLLRKLLGGGVLFVFWHPALTDKIDLDCDATEVQVWMFDMTKRAVESTEVLHMRSDESAAWWIGEWVKFAENKPNSFVTSFRQAAKIYPLSKVMVDTFQEAGLHRKRDDTQ